MAVQRVRVEDLTPGERKGLTDQGRDVPASGFMDLAGPAQPTMIDAKASARAQAAQELKSVAQPPRAHLDVPALTELTPAVPGVASAAVSQKSADVVKASSAEEPKASGVCPHCGWDTAIPCTSEPTKAEMGEFLRSVMAGEVYTKRVKLFGEAIEVLFRTRTEMEDEGVRDALRYLIRANKVENDRDLVNRVRRIHLALALDNLALGENKIQFENISTLLQGKVRDGDVFLEEVDRRLRRIPTQLLGALYNAFDIFTAQVETMTARAQDPVFWTGSAVTR